jgi:hypothetical protein
VHPLGVIQDQQHAQLMLKPPTHGAPGLASQPHRVINSKQASIPYGFCTPTLLRVRANIPSMSDHCIQLTTLIVQTLGVVGLAIYCFETYQIRKASQNQVSASQKLIKAALDQVEGTLKPCITLAARLREAEDVILEMHEAVGNLVAQADAGSYILHNIGSGAALNIRYSFTRPNVANPGWRYLPAVLASSRAALVETLGLFDDEHVATFEYESIGGRRYRSTVNLNHHVITAFRFEEI